MSEKEHQFDLSEIPQPIKVGYRTYRVEWEENWDAVNRNRLASHDPCKALITFCPWIDKQEAANCLIHEVLHAVWWMWCVMEKPNEETAIGNIANGLASVLADNPGLFEWIEGALRARECTQTNKKV